MSQNGRSKVVCIGLDSMDKDLAVEWAKAGLLPNLARIFEKATWGLVSCPPGVTTGAVWGSFNTGLLPGNHGLYAGASYFDANSYDDTVWYSDSSAHWQCFWERFDHLGRKCVVFDAPDTYSLNVQNGIVLQDWGTHDRAPHSRFCTTPECLKAEIETKFGLDDKVGRCDVNRPETDEEFGAFVENLIDRAQRKTAISHYLMDQVEKSGWDLFFVTFCESHCVGHLCWHIHDPQHHRYDSALAQKIGDPVLRVYTQLDASLGEIISRLDKNVRVLIYTGTGMEPHYTGTHLMDDILERIDGHKNRSLRAAVRQGLLHGLRPAWRMVPNQIRKSLMPMRVAGKMYLSDRQHRRYFEVRNTHQGAGIRLNVIGRERKGIIERGEEYDRVCGELMKDLATFRNRETGEMLFTEILKPAEIYDGEFVDVLPDIVAMWNRSAPIREVSSPEFGTVENKAIYARTGDHIPVGMFLACGPRIQSKPLNRIVSPTDFAPTLASWLGLGETNFDGRVISELMV